MKDGKQIYIYGWKNNEKRAELYGRPLHVICLCNRKSAWVEFLDNGQRECISQRAMKKLKGGIMKNEKKNELAQKALTVAGMIRELGRGELPLPCIDGTLDSFPEFPIAGDYLDFQAVLQRREMTADEFLRLALEAARNRLIGAGYSDASIGGAGWFEFNVPGDFENRIWKLIGKTKAKPIAGVQMGLFD